MQSRRRYGPRCLQWPSVAGPQWLAESCYAVTSPHVRCCTQELITAKAFYAGDEVVEGSPRVATTMSAGTGAAPGQAPPDLPSLLLDGRICYIGMPVTLRAPVDDMLCTISCMSCMHQHNGCCSTLGSFRYCLPSHDILPVLLRSWCPPSRSW